MINAQLESQLDKYMIERKIYTIRHLDEKMACQIMGITLDELNEYTREAFQKPFMGVVNRNRISEAQDIWSQSGEMPIRHVARKVGYGNVLVFLWYFWKYEHCLPSVWKKRMLIRL